MRLKRKQDESNSVPPKTMKRKKAAVAKQSRVDQAHSSISMEDFQKYICEMKVRMCLIVCEQPECSCNVPLPRSLSGAT